MAMSNLAPWNWTRRALPIRYEEEHPMYTLQREMNRIFDEFSRTWDVGPLETVEESLGTYLPKVDMIEDDKDLQITAELPGMNEKDIDVSLARNMLTITGEKKEEKEEKEEKVKGHYRMERHYGSIRRSIPLPCDVDYDKAEATFKNGVLHVRLPKTAEFQKQVKSIPVKKT